MRARLALHSAGIACELREIELRDKAPELLQASPKATVPVLTTDNQVLEQSLDIMLWALRHNDPENWLEVPQAAFKLIDEADNRFKPALDRYKYADRYENEDGVSPRQTCVDFINRLDQLLQETGHLYSATTCVTDMAIFPFIRQFAFVDKAWFDQQPWHNVHRWLDEAINSERFLAIMHKYPRWNNGDSATLFPDRQAA
jgi:glutathione S-transferase